MKKVSLISISSICLLILVGSLSVSYCLKAGVADFYSLAARDRLAVYESSGLLPPPEIWNGIQHDLEIAGNLSPDTSEYFEGQAYLYALRASMAIRFREIASQNFVNAEKYYMQALITRPMCSSVLGNLALINYYLGASDEKINHFSDLASVYGGGDPKAELSLFFLGKLRWDRLTEPQKTELLNKFEAASTPLKKRILNSGFQVNTVETHK